MKRTYTKDKTARLNMRISQDLKSRVEAAVAPDGNVSLFVTQALEMKFASDRAHARRLELTRTLEKIKQTGAEFFLAD